MASSMTICVVCYGYLCFKIIAYNVQQTELNDWQAMFLYILALCPFYVDYFLKVEDDRTFDVTIQKSFICII